MMIDTQHTFIVYLNNLNNHSFLLFNSHAMELSVGILQVENAIIVSQE